MLQNRIITGKQHETYILENNLAGGVFVSARTGENLVKSFYEIAAKVCTAPFHISNSIIYALPHPLIHSHMR